MSISGLFDRLAGRGLDGNTHASKNLCGSTFGSSIGIEVSPIDLREPVQIERAIATFAQRSNGGMILAAGATMATNVDLIIAAAARHKLPAIYIQRPFVAAGGLISYGPNFPDQYRRAADYVSRILRGEKPADLPVQAPNKYELAINLMTAKALGISVPLGCSHAPTRYSNKDNPRAARCTA